MRYVRRWRFSAVVAACLPSVLVMAVAAAPADADPVAGTAAGPGSENVSSTPGVSAEAWAAGRARYGKDVTAAQAVESFWTPQRMRAAKPVEELPFYQRAVKKFERQVSTARQHARNARGAKPPPAVRHRVEPRAGVLGTPTASVAAVDPGWDPWHPTARTSGKVFIETANGTAKCSGTIVNSEGQNTVWTAGHCVHSGQGGGFFSNWTFVPGYDDDLPDPRPHGSWQARLLWTKSGWADSSSISDDMGVAWMWPNASGTRIVAYFGGQGITTGIGTDQWQNAFGYPGGAPYDGGNLRACAGWSEPEFRFLWFWSNTIEIACDFTIGASGGGWLVGWDGNWGYLNGVNSRIDRAVGPTSQASPYFDDSAWSLYESTRWG